MPESTKHSTHNTLAPIVLFTYNRPKHTKKTLEALIANELAKDSELFVYQDGLQPACKNSVRDRQKKGASTNMTDMVQAHNEVREYIESIMRENAAKGYFKRVEFIQREQNLGLADSIIDGVSTIINTYGKIIVLEDDIVTSQTFLSYMNNALDLYENENKVSCVSGFVHPLAGDIPTSFFMKGADCWGWATWKRAWEHFNPNGKELLKLLKESGKIVDFDKAYDGASSTRGYTQMLADQIRNKNSSWAIRWIASCFLRDTYCLYPRKSLVQNIGFDIGTHCHGGDAGDPFFGILSNEQAIIDTTQPITEIPEIRAQCDKYYADRQKTLTQRVIDKINKLIVGGQESKVSRLVDYFQGIPIRMRAPFPYHLENSQLLTHRSLPLETYCSSDLAVIAHTLQNLYDPQTFFSVIIPTHNRAHSIMSCIDSVLAQSFKNFDIIIVDDASNDKTEALINSLKNPRITYHKFKENSGAQTARNTGIYLAKGQWIAFLDSDDLWHKNTLTHHHKTILKHTNTKNLFLYSACIVLDESTQKTRYWDLSPQDSLLLKAPAPMFQGMVASKLTFLQAGMLDEQVPSYQEWDTSISLARISQVLYTQEALFTYRLHAGDQISKNHSKDIAGYSYVIHKHKHEIIQTSILWWNLHLLTILQRCKEFSLTPDSKIWHEFHIHPITLTLIKSLIGLKPARISNKIARIALSCDYHLRKPSNNLL